MSAGTSWVSSEKGTCPAWIPACGPKFKLQVRDSAAALTEVREHPPASLGATNTVWRNFHEEASWYVAAATFDNNTPLPSGAVVGSCCGIDFYGLDAEGKIYLGS